MHFLGSNVFPTQVMVNEVFTKFVLDEHQLLFLAKQATETQSKPLVCWKTFNWEIEGFRRNRLWSMWATTPLLLWFDQTRAIRIGLCFLKLPCQTGNSFVQGVLVHRLAFLDDCLQFFLLANVLLKCVVRIGLCLVIK